MDDATIAAYLSRIGSARPERPGADELATLQQNHLAAVPFENLSIHLGEAITLDVDALVEKVVDRRRGGFCYELNGAFAALLSALGYSVTMHSARPFRPDGSVGPPFDHLALTVDVDDEAFLVDVGFGRFAGRPIRLASRVEQEDPEGVVLLVDTADGDVDVLLGGEPQYRLEPRPRQLADCVPTCWWQQTSPGSHFTQSLTCSLPTTDGRVTLSGDRLIRTVNGERHEQTLAGDGDVLAAYRDHFGISLDRLPSVPPARS